MKMVVFVLKPSSSTEGGPIGKNAYKRTSRELGSHSQVQAGQSSIAFTIFFSSSFFRVLESEGEEWEPGVW